MATQETIRQVAYAKYQLYWMQQHGYSLSLDNLPSDEEFLDYFYEEDEL
jgi:hypothetical protein